MKTSTYLISSLIEPGLITIELPGNLITIYEDYGSLSALYEETNETNQYDILIAPSQIDFPDLALSRFLQIVKYGSNTYFIYLVKEVN